MYILEYKDGVKPDKLSPKEKANMERCANFLVEMIDKYGKRFWKRSRRRNGQKPEGIRESNMMGNEWSVVCELFANGAFSADRQIKARHNESPGVLCDDEQPKGGIR